MLRIIFVTQVMKCSMVITRTRRLMQCRGITGTAIYFEIHYHTVCTTQSVLQCYSGCYIV
jgi:hypothetical protein